MRFQRPHPPVLSHAASYYAASEEASWFSNQGPAVRLLEARLSDRLGCHAVTAASGTSALIVALRAAMEGHSGGQYALMPAFTFAAVPCAALAVGLQPVFLDIDPVGWHISPETMRDALSLNGDVGAVVACTPFGISPGPDVRASWTRICSDGGVPLVVDSAAGLGAQDGAGCPLGGHGDFEIFSMHATKTFAVGEGGLVCVPTPAHAEAVRRIANFGFDVERRVSVTPGINAKMSELQAAMALAMLDLLDDVVTHRQALVGVASDRLKEAGWVLPPHVACSAPSFIPAAAPTPAERDACRARCHDHRIETRVYYESLASFPAFATAPRHTPLQVTDALTARILCLPLSNTMDLHSLEGMLDVVVGRTPSRQKGGR